MAIVNSDSFEHTKIDLRAQALARRGDLLPAERRAAAEALAARALPLAIAPGTVIAGYQPIRSEFDPLPLMHELAGIGATLALPIIVARDQPLRFHAWQDETPLVAGPFGILQPPAGSAAVEPDIVLVPLTAFDRTGHRIGYGGGYYDRTIQGLRRRGAVLAIGLAFAVQEIETVPTTHHDERLDLVLTERETIDFRGT